MKRGKALAFDCVSAGCSGTGTGSPRTLNSRLHGLKQLIHMPAAHWERTGL
jgi:hypothetical protein